MPRPATQLDGRKLCASTPAESGLPWPSLRTSAAFSHSSGANSMTSASAIGVSGRQKVRRDHRLPCRQSRRRVRQTSMTGTPAVGTSHSRNCQPTDSRDRSMSVVSTEIITP